MFAQRCATVLSPLAVGTWDDPRRPASFISRVASRAAAWPSGPLAARRRRRHARPTEGLDAAAHWHWLGPGMTCESTCSRWLHWGVPFNNDDRLPAMIPPTPVGAVIYSECCGRSSSTTRRPGRTKGWSSARLGAMNRPESRRRDRCCAVIAWAAYFTNTCARQPHTPIGLLERDRAGHDRWRPALTSAPPLAPCDCGEAFEAEHHSPQLRARW